MKILFLANRIPFPPYRGDKLKIYNLAQRLHRDCELHLITFVQHKRELAYRKELSPYFQTIHLVYLPVWRSWLNSALNFLRRTPFQVAYFRSRTMSRTVRTFLNSAPVDAVHVQHIRMAQYLQNDDRVPRILDLPDAFSLYWERRNQIPRKWFNRIFDAMEARRVMRYESITRVYDLNLACSVEDLRHLQQAHPKAKFALLRNGVNLDVFRFSGHDYSGGQTLLFTGNMDYAPNVDAVIYFVAEMLEPLRCEFPGLRLIIAGQRPVAEVRALASDHVKVTGFVEDLSAVYASADIVIAPLRFGAGTQNKVLEAMAMGVPVVCTRIGFAGLEIESGDGAILAADTAAFLDALRNLLLDASLRERVGQAGLRLARENFSWDIVARDLLRYFGNLVQAASSGVSRI